MGTSVEWNFERSAKVAILVVLGLGLLGWGLGSIPLSGPQIGKLTGGEAWPADRLTQAKVGLLSVGTGLVGLAALGWIGCFLLPGWRQTLGWMREVLGKALNELRVIRQEPLHFAIVALILATGAALLGIHSTRLLEYDEGFTYQWTARFGPAFIASYYDYPNNHIFHTLLVWLSTKLLGNSEVVIRLPAMAGALVTIAMTYAVGRHWYGRTQGLIAMAIVAASSELIYYGTNARGYTLQAALFLVQFWSVRRFLDTERHRGLWLVVYTTSGVLALWTLPSALFGYGIAFTACFVGLLTDKGRSERLAKILSFALANAIAVLLVLLCYSPITLVPGLAPITGNYWVKPLSPEAFQKGLFPWLGKLYGVWEVNWPPMFGKALLALAVLSLLEPLLRKERRVPLLPLILIPIALVLFKQKVHPFYRVFLFALPLLGILAAAGLASAIALVQRLIPAIAKLDGRRWRLAEIGAIAILAITTTLLIQRDTVNQADWTGRYTPLREVLAYAKQNGHPTDIVYGVCPADVLLQYYKERDDLIYMRVASLNWKKELPTTRRVWILYKTHGTWPKLPEIAQSMGVKQSDLKLAKQIDEALLYVYEVPQPAP